jgi:hypothetical protein
MRTCCSFHKLRNFNITWSLGPLPPSKKYRGKSQLTHIFPFEMVPQLFSATEPPNINPLTTTRRYTVAHFRRFFTVLVYSPIGVKFSPTTLPRTLYTVKKTNFENFQNFLVLKVLVDINNFMEKTFVDIEKKYIMNIFWFFYCRNLIRGHLVTTCEEKTVEKMTYKFFSNSAFSHFFQDFHCI